MALSMRLDKYLSHMGFGTRNDVKKLIKNGWVTINDETIKKADYNVKEDDRVCVDDEPVSCDTLRSLNPKSSHIILKNLFGNLKFSLK